MGKSMSLAAQKLELPADGRQSDTALAVARGTATRLQSLADPTGPYGDID